LRGNSPDEGDELADKADHRRHELSGLRRADLLGRADGLIGRDAALPWSRRKAMVLVLAMSAIGWAALAILLR
jgi:hypothetical protein